MGGANRFGMALSEQNPRTEGLCMAWHACMSATAAQAAFLHWWPSGAGGLVHTGSTGGFCLASREFAGGMEYILSRVCMVCVRMCVCVWGGWRGDGNVHGTRWQVDVETYHLQPSFQLVFASKIVLL